MLPQGNAVFIATSIVVKFAVGLILDMEGPEWPVNIWATW